MVAGKPSSDAHEIGPFAQTAPRAVSHIFASMDPYADWLGSRCAYDLKRSKPGVKPGAIEGIHRRLDVLEERFECIGDTTNSQTSRKPDTAAETVLKLLARELPKLINPNPNPENPTSSRKRRRVQDGHSSRHKQDVEPSLPSSDIVDALVDVYFTHVHPWIPMLNQDRFRAKMDALDENPGDEIILHAITITCARYLSRNTNLELDWALDKIHDWILLTALQNHSIEGLQALIIVVFNQISNGDASKAWSIVASLTRTVEFLQLTVDMDDKTTIQPICRPFSYIAPAKDWVDQEERRRVFWNVFLLDRFCSITMGWNTSLTAIDVHQRLPCDGILWRKQEAVTTPYLGIWDKSTGGMGNLNTASTGRRQSHSSLDTPTGPSFPNTDTDVSRIGAFAYCVEAMESMSRVTTYFLQQQIDPHDTEAVNSWLARFKELDLRLVHWKMFLPQKWKANVPKQPSRMDPNLTLAHIIHNASTILLHQVIAWPRASWPFRRRLPSVWSAETCVSAGIEISNITRKYLENTPEMLPLNLSFAFCVYIAARMMLVSWKAEGAGGQLDEFWAMTGSLDEMSTRWRGGDVEGPARDLAAQYASKLRELQSRCVNEAGFEIDVASYTQEIDHRSWSQPNTLHHMTEGAWVASNAEMTGPMPGYQQFAAMNGAPVAMGGNGVMGQSPLSDRMFATGENYLMDLDRVISFNDGSLFSASLESGW